MKKHLFELPSMYGDHHVTEVRRLLTDLPGVSRVYASSGFRIVEVDFDEKLLTAAQIEGTLEKAGYRDDLDMPIETGAGGGPTYFRKSTAYAQTGNVVGFGQQVPFTGRPLWPCPDIGPLRRLEEEQDA